MKKTYMYPALLALTFAVVIAFSLSSCGEDDPAPEPDPVPAANTAPTFDNATYAFTVAENSAEGIMVGRVSATDADGNDLTYSITTTQTEFAIDDDMGAITVAADDALDFETATSYSLTVQVSDGTVTATATVTITITGVDEAPVSADAPYTFSIAENSAVGTAVGTVEATDPEGVTTVTYSFNPASTDFEIDEDTGEITVASGTALDFETTASYSLTVEVSDGTQTAMVSVTVDVSDVNEAPVFDANSYSFTIAEDASAAVGTVSATDPDAGATLTYSIMGAQTDFDIDNAGAITVASGAALDFETTKMYALIVEVSDGTEMVTVPVSIEVTDVNEPPTFELATYSFTVPVDWDGSAPAVQVEAIDPEGADITYELSGTDEATFTIDAMGVITPQASTLAAKANNEDYAFTVTATSGTGESAKTDIATVSISTTTGPVFGEVAYNFSVDDGSVAGDEVGTVEAVDATDDPITYTLGGADAASFTLADPMVGAITVAVTLSARADPYEIEVTATAGGETATAVVTIKVDIAPVFVFEGEATAYTFEVDDESPAGTIVGTVEATDANGDAITYSLMSGTGFEDFSISNAAATAGVITVAAGAPLDAAMQASYELTVEAAAGGSTVTAMVSIKVDAAPVFVFAGTATAYAFNVADGADAGENVGTVVATDSNNDVITYSIEDGMDAASFALADATVGAITVAAGATISAATKASYEVEVTATSGTGENTKTATAMVTITPTTAPVFAEETYTFTVENNLAADMDVGTVTATGADTYSLTGDDAALFEIDDSTGEITVATGETLTATVAKTSYTITVTATSSGGTDTATVTIELNVTDYLDGNALIDITTLEQLNAVRWDLDGDGAVDDDTDAAAVSGYAAAFPNSLGYGSTTPTGYELMADLDFTGSRWADASAGDGEGWDPIGDYVSSTDNDPFVATFAGNSNTISNLFIARGTEDHIGLFAVTGTASVVRGVGLVGVNVTGRDETGSLVGRNSGTIAACYAMGSVTNTETVPSSTDVGGLVGLNTEGTIERCYAIVSVTGTGFSGGLVGVNSSDGIIRVCYATGNVTGTGVGPAVGGLAGQGGGGSITACYATGDVTAAGASAQVGGLFGQNQRDITACYATGTVTASSSNIGGLVGLAIGSTVTASYFNRENTSQTDADQGKTTAELQGETGYSGIYITWDDHDIDGTAGPDMPWAFGTATEYPILNVDFNGDGVTDALDTDPQPKAQGNRAPRFAQGSYEFTISTAAGLAAGASVGTVAATDGEGDAITYELGGTGATAFVFSAGDITVAAGGLTEASYTLTLTATATGGEATANIIITVAIDYLDGNRLIDIRTLEQLNAMRWDLDGDGAVDAANQAAYDAAFFGKADFPTEDATKPQGYELQADLDFTGSTWASGEGWVPVGDNANRFVTAFEGNGNTISNLFVNRPAVVEQGLFGVVGSLGVVRRIGMVNVGIAGLSNIGGLIGSNNGTITACYVTGSVSGGNNTGGLIGANFAGAVAACYSTASVTPQNAGASVIIGGLIGAITEGTITACYATGDVTGIDGITGGLVGNDGGTSVITACYATGSVTSTSSNIGGLVGVAAGTITNSYFDSETTGQTHTTRGKTTSQLTTPTGYTVIDGTGGTAIYTAWNVDVDDGLAVGVQDGTAAGDAAADDVWDFGNAGTYPALQVDFDGNGTATADEFGRQPRVANFMDYLGANTLIDITTLEQLNAMRWDLDGDGVPTSAGATDYAAAFPGASFPTGTNAPTGYELMVSLDFDSDDSYAGAAADFTWAEGTGAGAGWEPVGDNTNDFDAIFDGNGNTISNLFINRSTNRIGLFGSVGSTGVIRGVGMVGVNVTGVVSVGGLVGSNEGTITTCYVTGSVTGGSRVGGLVGDNFGLITACYVTTSVTGNVVSGANTIGGLVGVNSSFSGSEIIACYATGSVVGTMSDITGGLVGQNDGPITACYATGAVSVTGTSTSVGGLVGASAGTITDSYFDFTINSGLTQGTEGKTTMQLQTPTGYDVEDAASGGTAIYATWDDSDLDDGLDVGIDVGNAAGDAAADAVWDFGTASEYPVLKVDFNKDGTATATEFGTQR